MIVVDQAFPRASNLGPYSAVSWFQTISSAVGTPPPPPPASTYNDNVMSGFGDSISVSGSYAETWDISRPDWSLTEIAQNGRQLGTIANLNDGGNTVYGHLAQLLAVNSEVVYGFIGANDCTKSPAYTAGEASAYVASFQYIVNQVKANGAKFVLCTILPVSPAYVGVPSTLFNQNRDILNAALAAGLTGVDAVADFGVEPTFISGGVVNPLAYVDGIHPDVAGHAALTAVFDTVADSVADALTVTYLPANNWLGVDQTVTPNTLISGQFRVRDMAPGATIGLTIAGATAQIALNGGAFGTTVAGARNGSIIRWQVTSPATGTLAVTLTNTGGTLADTLTLTASASAATTVFSQANKTTGITLTNADRTATSATNSGYQRVRSSAPLPDASYCEIEVLDVSATGLFIGVAAAAQDMTTGAAPPNGSTAGGYVAFSAGAGTNQSVNFPGADAFHFWTTGCAVGDKLGLAFKNGKVYLNWKGVWMNSIPSGNAGGWQYQTQSPQGNPATETGGFTLSAGQFYAFVQSLSGVSQQGAWKINCGQEAFSYAVPSGFTAVG